ncbi:maleylpyruvate isomerase mycothiol-dependent enzyme family protein [Marisediminicola antarctica]|nr:hypothetical protein [Marisediminicola antarctica]
MSDFSRHLPLSQRGSGDESTVTNDWRPLTGECLMLVCTVLEGVADEGWDAPSLRAGWRVRDVAGDLAWRLDSSALDRVRRVFRAVLLGRGSPASGRRIIAARLGDSDPHEFLRQLRATATDRLARRGPHGVAGLRAAVVDGYDLARSLGRPLAFPGSATGAVALASVLAASTPIKAVARGRALRATDAGWTVGRGPELAGTAESIILFLAGRSGTLPQEGKRPGSAQ